MSKGCDHCRHPLWAGIRCGVCGRWADENGDPSEKLEAAWDAYKKALKEFDCPRCGHNCSQSEQEPVAWIHKYIHDAFTKNTPHDLKRHPDRWIPLFAHPPRREWQGLTDEEIHNLPYYQETREMYRFARAVEALLKEKNK
jgi:hypothetical protein